MESIEMVNLDSAFTVEACYSARGIELIGAQLGDGGAAALL